MDKENPLRLRRRRVPRAEERDSRNYRDDQKELRAPHFPDVT